MNVVALRRFPAENRQMPVDCTVAEVAIYDDMEAAEAPGGRSKARAASPPLIRVTIS